MKENWTQLTKRPVKRLPDKVVFEAYNKSGIIVISGSSLLKRFDVFDYVDVYYREDAKQIGLKPRKEKMSDSYKLTKSRSQFQFSARLLQKVFGIKETIELVPHWENDVLVLDIPRGNVNGQK